LAALQNQICAMFPSPAIGGVHAQAAANGLASPDSPASGTDWANDAVPTATTTTATVTEPTDGDFSDTATVRATVATGSNGDETSTYSAESGSVAVVSTTATESVGSTTVTESETSSISIAFSTGAAVAGVRGMGWGVVEGLLGVGVMALL
ncbi:hypothetical protein LTS18_006797, partial [Coniosporium uncinatum]